LQAAAASLERQLVRDMNGDILYSFFNASESMDSKCFKCRAGFGLTLARVSFEFTQIVLIPESEIDFRVSPFSHPPVSLPPLWALLLLCPLPHFLFQAHGGSWEYEYESVSRF
jgi:hypothetical protein